MTWDRITVRVDQCGGVPCIRGIRIPVSTVVGLLAEGLSRESILADYPDLVGEDIDQALRFAAVAVSEREIPLVGAA